MQNSIAERRKVFKYQIPLKVFKYRCKYRTFWKYL